MTKTCVDYTIRRMTKRDILAALDVWASHGYYECLNSVQTFLTVDSEGFFVAVDTRTGQVIGCCGGPFLRPDTAFIGLYTVLAEHSGRGIGPKLFDRVLAHVGDRNCCLFAVPSKARLYRERLGFGVEAGPELIVYFGKVDTDLNNNYYFNDCVDAANGPRLVGKLTDDLMAKVVEYDRRVHGYDRQRLLQLSLRESGCATLVALEGSADDYKASVVGYGCIRVDSGRCGSLCPVYADNDVIAKQLIDRLVWESPNARTNGYYYYAISSNEGSVAIARELRLENYSQEPLLCKNTTFSVNYDKIYSILSNNFSL